MPFAHSHTCVTWYGAPAQLTSCCARFCRQACPAVDVARSGSCCWSSIRCGTRTAPSQSRSRPTKTCSSSSLPPTSSRRSRRSSSSSATPPTPTFSSSKTRPSSTTTASQPNLWALVNCPSFPKSISPLASRAESSFWGSMAIITGLQAASK